MNWLTYTLFTLVLLVLFVGIVAWVFSSKRKKRFEQDARIPLRDEAP